MNDDVEKFRPDDLETEHLFDGDPEFRRLWVNKRQLERDFGRLSSSETPTGHYVLAIEQLKRARQELQDYCTK